MSLDATFFALLGFVAFFAIVFWTGAHKIVLRRLDDRALAIAAELKAAETLRKDAHALLREQQGKRNAAESQAESILRQAKADAEALRLEAEKALAADIARRERQAEERIARAEAQALAEVRAAAVDAAIETAERLLKGELGARGQAALVESGVKGLSGRFS